MTEQSIQSEYAAPLRRSLLSIRRVLGALLCSALLAVNGEKEESYGTGKIAFDQASEA